MIEYVKGELAELTPAYAVVETSGVGYGLNITLNTYTAIQGKKEVRLYVFESIREDSYTLYGFASKDERRMFLLLITVSAGYIAQIVTPAIITEMAEIGALLILAIAMNLLHITKLSVGNLIVAPYIPIVLYLLHMWQS